MLKKKSYPTIPSFRHKFFFKLIEGRRFINKLKLNLSLKKTTVKRIKYFSKPFCRQISLAYKKNIFIIFEIIYKLKPLCSMFYCKNIYNTSIQLPAIRYKNIGKRYCLYKDFNLIKKPRKLKAYLGLKTLLKFIPFNMHICFIMNNLQTKWTYSKSSDTKAKKIKAKKKDKLIKVLLPSNQYYYFFSNIFCFVGTCPVYKNNKLIEGSWGFSLKHKKKINVRGVAMNPVDHPNGGRAKAKQPEKTPWGWVAKLNK